MAKKTIDNTLPGKLRQELKLLGMRIKLARLRRKLSIKEMADLSDCPEITIFNVEEGSATVSIGDYLRILYVFQLDGSILLLAKDDPVGEALEEDLPEGGE